ncbi:hypothetical protein ACIOGZ_29090 [Kitasatospora sp. NPDC088160]|uniref:hypothetical protein n=1 Tax=Kitasatospora sp. NPDC088160 TaxID=3364072 RepID=UPI0037F87D41
MRAPRPPADLRAPWRRLPELAGVLAQAFAPAAAHPGWLRALFAPFWLVEAGIQRCTGRVLSQGPATLVLCQPRPWGRRVLETVVLLPAAVAAFFAVFAPAAVVGAVAGTAAAGAVGRWYGMAVAVALVAVLLLWQFVSLVPAARAGVRLRRAVRVLRGDGPWAEVGSLAGGRDGQATRDLVRAVLEWADGNGVALVAVAADERLARLYGRAGFEALCPASPVLVRRPRPAGSSWRPPARTVRGAVPVPVFSPGAGCAAVAAG